MRRAAITLQPMPGSRRYVIIGDTEVDGYMIPNGYQTDGASIPRPFWFLVGSPFTPEVIRAAMVHDYLYAHHVVPRLTADDVLHRVMLADGLPRWRALLIHVAVRVFGGLFW